MTPQPGNRGEDATATPDAERCTSCGAPARPAPDRSSPASAEPAPGTHCEWCGAEYEAPAGD